MIFSRFVIAIVALIGFGAAALSVEARAADANPFIGTWKLNVEKSTFVPGSAPKSITRKTEDLGDGKLKTTLDMVGSDDKATHAEGTYAFDGKDYPVTGNSGFDSVAVKRIDATTIEVTRKLAGKAVDSYKVQVSADGKTLTQTTPGATPDAQPTIAVFDKQ